MKFSSISIATVFAFAGQSVLGQTIGEFEILHLPPVAELVRPYDPDFDGRIFIEIDPHSKDQVKAAAYGMLDQANAPDCSSGTPLANFDYEVKLEAEADVAHPGVPTLTYPGSGEAAQLLFSLDDIRSETSATDGASYNVCIQVGYQADLINSGTPYFVSSIETDFEASQTFVGDFADFSNLEISISERSTTLGVADQLTNRVGVSAGLCDSSNVPVTNRVYELGQDFRICVTPDQYNVSPDTYSVSSFSRVTCTNGDLVIRNLVDPVTSQADAVTRVDTQADQGGTLGVTSLLTPDFFDGPALVLSCYGQALIAATPKRRRLQENEEEVLIQTDAEFTIGIPLSDVRNTNINGARDGMYVEASAFAEAVPRFRLASVAVAIAAMVVAW